MATIDYRISFKLEDRKIGKEEVKALKGLWVSGYDNITHILRMIEQMTTPQVVAGFVPRERFDDVLNADWYAEERNGLLFIASAPINTEELGEEVWND